MAIKFTFGSVNSDNGSLFFRSSYGENFYVKSLNKGVLVIEPMQASNLPDLLETIVSSFTKGSNFYGLRAIEFEFNGVYISVNKKNANVENLLDAFHERAKKLDEENQKARNFVKKFYDNVEN